MEIRVLRYFLMAAREENLTRAAARLYVSQPTLSRQLKQLEAEVGRKLFIRSNYSIQLTEEGRRLKKRAEDILEMHDRTLEEFQTPDEDGSGEVYIGAAETRAFAWLARTCQIIQKQMPSLIIHLYAGNTETVIERLEQGLIDFALIVEEADTGRYSCLQLPFQDRWGLIFPKSDPLAGQSSVTVDDLLNRPLIVSRQGLKEDYPRWFREKQDQLQIVADFDLIFNASILAETGYGYLLGFDGLVNTGPSSLLTFRPLSPPLTTSSYLVWKKYEMFSPAARQFLEALEQLTGGEDPAELRYLNSE